MQSNDEYVYLAPKETLDFFLNVIEHKERIYLYDTNKDDFTAAVQNLIFIIDQSDLSLEQKI